METMLEYNNSYHVHGAKQRQDCSLDPGRSDSHVELYYEGTACKIAHQPCDQPLIKPLPGEQLVTIYASKHKPGKKKVVVDREDSNLSAADVIHHWPEVAAAIQK